MDQKELQDALDNSIKQANLEPIYADGIAIRGRIKYKINQQMEDKAQGGNTVLWEIIFYDSITKIAVSRVLLDTLTANDLIAALQQTQNRMK